MAAYSTTSQSLYSEPATYPASPPYSRSPQQAPPGKAAYPESLWLCAFFPELPLEVAGYEPGNTEPFAVFEETGGRALIYMASMAASGAGIARGLALSQAHALCPALKTRPRNVAAEVEGLSQLAEQAGRFTPTVSLQPPQALLLEISASLRIFGGLTKLKMELSNQLFASGAGGHVAVTPTPSASLLLASQGQSAALFEQDALRSHLGKLPVGVLPLDPDAIHRLIRMGVRTLHDLWRLPRQGLARRFGPRLLDFLDRALGLLPDPRPIFHPSPRFAAELELPYAVDDTPVLLTAASQLIAKLVKFLRERNAAVSRLQLDLCHVRLPPSRLQLGTRHGTCDAEHLIRLLEEHLRHFRLPAPVIKLGLTSAAIQPFTASNRSLFARHESSSTSSSPPPHNDAIASGQDWQQVIEQLQARLGREAVQGLEVLADHRPEQALKYVEPGSQTSYVSSYRRPLWLLPAPQPLPSRQGRPRRRGLLSIASGPERVESGWWDNRDVHRDYYIASDTDGSRLWIFHDLRGDHTWYLHGLFG